MLSNYLSTSGTVQGVQGDDAKAPSAYWNNYTYHPVTSGELSGLINGDIYSTALSLAPGEYTCLEISFDEPVYVGQIRCYLGVSSDAAEVTLSYPHTTEEPTSYFTTVTESGVGRENVQGTALYYDRISSSTGYVEGEPVSLIAGEWVQLIEAVYFTTVSGNPTTVQTGFENKTIKQIIEPEGDDYLFTRISLTAGSSPVNLDKVSIAPVEIDEDEFDFSHNTQDDDRRDELRWWYADQAERGHFEGRIIPLDYGAEISGTWDQQVTWSGNTSRQERSDLAGYTVRQPIPASALEYTGDGVRVTLRGGSEDIHVKYMSYMPSNSTEFKLEFGSSADIYQENLKHDIEQWKCDGDDGESWESQLSRRTGHFESYEVDIDNAPAIMYSENVIGIPATSHGLKAGDYIRIEGTTYYDGYYYILTYSTPHIIVIWGIWDPETFTSAAKIRRVVSIGTAYDDYGVKPDCRGVVPYTQVNFVTGDSSHILSFTDSGKLHGSVVMGPDEVPTAVVSSVYDITIDNGWLCNAPGPATTPDFEQSIPNMRYVVQEATQSESDGTPNSELANLVEGIYRLGIPESEKSEGRWPDRYYYDDSKAIPDIGYHDSGYGFVKGGKWKGKFSFISESQDPDYEGDMTGWTGLPMLFDRKMAQPWWTLISLADCPWITMSYRGPIVAKFILDLGEQRLLNKYRYWIQTFICPDNTIIGWPKSWKVEASNHGDNTKEWVTLHEEVDYSMSRYFTSETPPDGRVPHSCAEGEWADYRLIEPYRYYRFNVYESWTCTENEGAFECCHIDEIDFVEHRCTAGIFPTIIETPLYLDVIGKIIPDEHLRMGSQIFYAISFDDAESFEVYLPHVDKWRTIAKYENDEWLYFDGLIWREMDADKPEENTVRFALWHAFSVEDNRMNSTELQAVPEAAYRSRLPQGGYVKFAVGLTSNSSIEAMLKGITVSGTVFNPVGTAAPTEVTFSGGHGCVVPALGTVTSDWINSDLLPERDALFVMDFGTTASAIPYYDYAEDYKYFYRGYVTTYDLRDVEVNDYTLASGVILIDSVETRQSDTVTLPAATHNLPEGAYVRVSGTYSYYDGYHYVVDQRPGSFDIVSKHWPLAAEVPSGSYVQRRYSVGPGNMQPHTQVGSILRFKNTGGYYDFVATDTDAYPYFTVSSNVDSPELQAHNLFDYDTSAEFHSGQPISYGPVIIGLSLSEAKSYDRYRFKASNNDFYWEFEYPQEVVFCGSNSASPSLTNDADWEVLSSGIANLSIGPGRFADWNTCSSSGTYSHYRFKINSNRGVWYSAVRAMQLEVGNEQETLGGYTLVDIEPGFSSPYLLDDSAYSEYMSTTSGLPAIHIDFRNNPRSISSLRFRASKGLLFIDPTNYDWDLCFPKLFLLSGSNDESPSLSDDSAWSHVSAFSYDDHPYSGDWAAALPTQSGTEYDPYRHYRIKFVANQSMDVITTTYDVPLTGSFPYTLLTLPAGSIIHSVKVEVRQPDPEAEAWDIARGGYSEQQYEFGPTSYQTGFGYANYHLVRWDYYPLRVGKYLTQFGWSNEGPFMSLGIAHPTGTDTFDQTTIPVIGTTSSGWVKCSTPTKVPNDNIYYPYAYGFGYDLRQSEKVPMSWRTMTTPSYSRLTSARPNIAVRYGNKYHIGDDDNNSRFVEDYQPYHKSEEAEWSGDYGPYGTTKAIKIYRDSIAADTEGVIRVTITRLATATSNLPIRVSEMSVGISEELKNISYVSYSGTLPTKLMDIPPWHRTTGGLVTVTEAFTGGYAEQVGHVGTGTFDNSFWTIVDRHWQLENSRAIAQVGIYADTPTDISLKLFKVRTGTEWFDISEIQTLTHSGTGFEWFTLLQPHLIPDDGTYHLGWWQPNYPVKMGDGTGSNLVSFEYGDYTGTNIHLPYYNAMRPCLAVRYASSFTIGIENTDDVQGTFSPAIGERTYPFEKSYGPYPDVRSIYLYSDCTMTAADTQGSMRIEINHEDTQSDNYGASLFTVQDNGHLSFSRTARNLHDDNGSTDLFSYRKLQTAEPLAFIARFDQNVRVLAFRYREGTDHNLFPVCIEVMGSQTKEDIFNSLSWDVLYEDEAYFAGNSYWGPWVYIDDYVGNYRYYAFKLHHFNDFVDVASIGGVEFLVEYNKKVWVVVPELYNAVHNIYNTGMDESEVKARSHAGSAREITNIYDTFSSYGKNELSPGTYFYRGENTPWSLNPQPDRITKIENGVEKDINLTDPYFGGMKILAWHPMVETTGNFSDLSGNGVTAYRVGTIGTRAARHGLNAALIEDEEVAGHARFTMPHHLDEYTVAFWYSPAHRIYSSYNKQFDIMGGWISYGAIPGVWHISMAQHMRYLTEPYPPVQTHDISGSSEFGSSGRMVFGNYGTSIVTSRNYWHINSWYHVVFSFKAGGDYKCWINGVPDDSAEIFDDSVYPPPDVIMVDPDDIHYDTHAKHNCMYFGLPLEDGAGTLYEHALQHVMHFNKVLTDEEVFKIYRMRMPLSEEWDGIYFPDTEAVESPGQIIVDLGSPKCVTKYGLMVPSGVTDNVWCQFVGSGTQGAAVLHETYADFETMPEYFNILNPDAYQYYIVNFLGSADKADYLFINGIRMVDVPHIPTVSGTYETVTSGVQDKQTLIEMSPQVYEPSGSTIGFTMSVDEGQTWWAMASGTWVPSGTMTYSEVAALNRCDYEALGSGTLYVRHQFTSDPMLVFPAVTSLDTRQTDWTTASAMEFTITGTIGANMTNTSEWLRYAQDQSTHHLLIFDFSPTGGNPSYSEIGPGCIIDATYTCSGLYLVSEVEGRKDDLVSIKASSVSSLEAGNLVGIQDAGPYNGYWVVASGFTSDLWVYAPYEPYQVTAGAEYRRVIPSAIEPGSEMVMPSGIVCVLSSSGNVVTIDSDMGSQEIQAVHHSIITEHGIQPTREIRTNEGAGIGTNVIRLDLTSNSGTNYRVFESTEDPELYKAFDGSIEENHSITRAVIDLGEPVEVNSYRWFYGYTTTTGVAPDYWEVYATNELPFWEQITAVNGSTPENWEWSQNYDLPTASGYQYYLFKFYESVDLREIELLRKNIMPTVDNCVTVTSGWEYSGLGRLSSIKVHSEEPDNTYIFHGVTFDGGNSYCIFEDNAWESVVQLNGSTWQYKDTSWHNASENTVYGAFRDAIEEASQLFSTPLLEAVSEMEWHGSGAIQSSSGTVGLIQYYYSPTINTPLLGRYEFLYQATPSGISDLIPEGYSFGSTTWVQAATGTYCRHSLEPETSSELLYGRKLIDKARVYVTSPGNALVTEVAALDVTTPNDSYYLETNTYLTQDDPIYALKTFAPLAVTSFVGSTVLTFDQEAGVIYGLDGGYIKSFDLDTLASTTGPSIPVGANGVAATMGTGDIRFFTPGSGTMYTVSGTTVTMSGSPSFGVNDTADIFVVDGSLFMLKYSDPIQMWVAQDEGGYLLWEEFVSGPGPLPRHRASAVYDEIDRCIWMYGGSYQEDDGTHVYGDFWKFDIDTRVWECKESGPGEKYGVALCLNTNTNNLYLTGGNDGEQDVYATWVYDKRWDKWVDLTDEWGCPLDLDLNTISSVGKPLFHHKATDYLYLVGNDPLNKLGPYGNYDVAGNTGKKLDYFLGEITDEHHMTGGISLDEQDYMVIKVSDIPASKKIYYGEMRVYFDPDLGPPSGRDLLSWIPSSDVPIPFTVTSTEVYDINKAFDGTCSTHFSTARVLSEANPAYVTFVFDAAVILSSVRFRSWDHANFYNDFPSVIYVYSKRAGQWVLTDHINMSDCSPSVSCGWGGVKALPYSLQQASTEWMFKFVGSLGGGSYYTAFSEMDLAYYWNTGTPAGMTTTAAVSQWHQYSNYMSAFLWSDTPLENIGLQLFNENEQGQGPQRITEFEIHPITYSGTWSVEDVFNLIEQSHTYALAGVEGYPQYSFQVLPTPHLERLITDVESAIPIMPGYGIATESNFYEFGGKSSEIRAYLDSASGVEVGFLTRVSGEADWNEYYPTWNGDSFSYVFHSPENVSDLRIVIGNYSSIGETETVSYTKNMSSSAYVIPDVKGSVKYYRSDDGINGHFEDVNGDFIAASGVDSIHSGTKMGKFIVHNLWNTTSGTNDVSLYPTTIYDVGVSKMENLQLSSDKIEVVATSTNSDDLIPKLSSNSENGYEVIYSSYFLSYYPWKAFDKRSYSDLAWHADIVGFPCYIGIKIPDTAFRVVNKYRMQARYDCGRWPLDWAFQASNNGVDWVTLHYQVNYLCPGGSQWSQWFEFDNTVPFAYYRVYITNAVAGGAGGILEMQLGYSSEPSFVPGVNVTYPGTELKCSNWAHINNVVVDETLLLPPTISGTWTENVSAGSTGSAYRYNTIFSDNLSLDNGKTLTRVYFHNNTNATQAKFKLVSKIDSNTFYFYDLLDFTTPQGAVGAWYDLDTPIVIPDTGDYYIGVYYLNPTGSSPLKPFRAATGSTMYAYTGDAVGKKDIATTEVDKETTIGVEYAEKTAGIYYLISFDNGITWRKYDPVEEEWIQVAAKQNDRWYYRDASGSMIAPSTNDMYKAMENGMGFADNKMSKFYLESITQDEWHHTGGFTKGQSTGFLLAAGLEKVVDDDYVSFSSFDINYELFAGTVDATYDQIRWLRAIQLINCGDEIDFGTTGSGENTLELPTYYTDYNKLSIYNNNRSGTPANARILPRYSGDYHLDRTIRVSEDTVNWATVEDGVRMPEDYPWEMGEFENTRVSEDKIMLVDTEVSGTWKSPVIEVLDPSSTAAYVYVKNVNYDQSYVADDFTSINNILKVRVSPEKPMQLFLATAVNTDQQDGIQAPWKASLFRSDGELAKSVRYYNGPTPIWAGIDTGALDVDEEPYAPRRYWSTSEPYVWQFYGALDSRGFAGLSLGVHWQGSFLDSSQYDQYRLYRGFPQGTGQTYPVSTYGDNTSEIHIYDTNWMLLPIFNQTLRMVEKKEGGIVKNCWQMVDVVYRPEPFYELYQENYFSDKLFHARNLYSFPGASNTPEANTEIDYLYSFEGTLEDLENDGIRCAACPDNIIHETLGHYYWMHYACEYETNYHKTLLVNGQTVVKEFDHIERKFNFMVEAGEGAPTRGFWGITQAGVFWYKYDGSNLTELFGVTADNISSFKRIHHGCVDFQNNLWFVDLATERVVRVNFKTQKVDYSRVIAGAASVACDPFDGSAYVYVVRPPEFTNNDAIKIVHVGDYDYLEPETVCAVPGIALLDSFNVNLIARSTTPAGYYDVLPQDPVWGDGVGSAPWIKYSAAAPILPKGMYKQFKLTLRREDLEAASPEVEYLRIPIPAILNKIPWHGYKDIFVDTIPRQQNYDLVAGTHTLDLLVWWTRE